MLNSTPIMETFTENLPTSLMSLGGDGRHIKRQLYPWPYKYTGDRVVPRAIFCEAVMRQWFYEFWDRFPVSI